jgi:DNA-binding MarR family transcriptional regulator
MSGAGSLIDLIDEVVRLRGRVMAATSGFGESSGLSSAQMTVVTAVVNARRPPTVPQIARSLGLSRQAIQRVADTLVEAGLLSLADNPDHQRAKLLVATDRARRAQRDADRLSRSWAERVIRGMPTSDIDHATETLRELRTRIEADAARRRALAG